MSAGIDYGMGLSNIDLDTGIRYGIVSANSLSSWVQGQAEPQYPDTAEAMCKECDHTFEASCLSNEFTCPQCGNDFTEDWDCLEAVGFDYTPGSSEYDTEYSESLCAVIITKSPYYTLCRFASPCFPGGGDLDSPDDEGIKAYCLGLDYFDGDDPCPYTVYSVETNEVVTQDKQTISNYNVSGTCNTCSQEVCVCGRGETW